jgi:spoIIIJ-associated protein
MNEIVTTAKTKEKAIQKALEKLQTTRDRVEVIPLAEPSGGILSFLGLSRAKVKVRLLRDDQEDLPKAERILTDMLRLIGIEGSVTGRREDDTIRLEIKTDKDGGLLIGRRGQTLWSLGFLVERMISDPEEDRKRVTVDVNGYVRDREDNLTSKARSMAAEALEKNRALKTEPLPARERQIIHRLFESDERIETYSVGNESFRSVMIAPKGLPRDEDRERGRSNGARNGDPRRRRSNDGRDRRRRRR